MAMRMSDRSFGHSSSREVLTAYIERCCDPSLHEPNLALNLEIADFINSKKANTPREAAVEVMKLVNHRNTHTSMLALHLLDILVKNCGYPFHLQISTKDFLNELVRRFPERPPVFPPPPMAKILELVHEWKNELCVHSKHKEDLVHIRDMHRLLSHKGYRFPDYDKRNASVLNPSTNLQTPDELEEEDRAAQAAKLQELIRRGTPKDLAAAQELMKVMSGAEPEKRPDYEQQVQKELDRIQQRILLLNEMLNNAKPNERFADGDAYDQIAQKCRQVQPKMQKWIEESAESDPDAMDRLLLMNDLINNIINRYQAFKAGDRSATADIDATFSTPSTSSTKPKAAAPQVSLIDFDFDEPPPPPPSSTSTPTPAIINSPAASLLDDLSSLSLGAPPSASSPYQSNQTSLFDMFPIASTSTPPPPPPPLAPPISQNRLLNNITTGSGSYFSNPGAYKSNLVGTSGSASPTSGINWGNSPTSSIIGSSTPTGLGRSSTPITPGVIQLGGNGNVSGGSMNGNSKPQGASMASQAKPDPFADLSAWE